MPKEHKSARDDSLRKTLRGASQSKDSLAENTPFARARQPPLPARRNASIGSPHSPLSPHQRTPGNDPARPDRRLSARVAPVETAKRPSIDAMSPTLESAFSSPASLGPVTSSTESTESAESTGTVRHSLLKGIEQTPLRTPSYPFPYVRPGESPTHQPFTDLSPMTTSPGPRLRFQRTGSKLAPSSPVTEQPGPDLYNLVLQINSEPNLQLWWERLISIMRNTFSAERLSLTVPVDPSDLDNVPWGQKASYDATGLKTDYSGPESSSSSSDPSKSVHSLADYLSSTDRPTLETRHSYAGYEAEISKEEKVRPSVPRRTTVHTPGAGLKPLESIDIAATMSPSPSVWQALERDLRGNATQRQIVHGVIKPLNREPDALLESSNVNRVLQKDSTVLLTRNFIQPDPRTNEKLIQKLERAGSLGDLFSMPGRQDYEDYEQIPASPWAQSPAPSPAVQADANVNPFFGGEVSEDTFEPKDDEEYTSAIPAIGIDHASTVIHLPLIHPWLSKPLQEEADTPQRRESIAATVTNEDRRTPLAILSIMSKLVPYPPHLVESLQDLGPHLATSFFTCNQNSMIQDKITRALARKRRSRPSGVNDELEPWSLGVGLDSVLRYEHDDTASSTFGSINSPSEGQSAHSAPSPSASPFTPAVERGSYFEHRTLERSRSTAQIPSDHRSQLRKVEPLEKRRREPRAPSSGRTSPTREAKLETQAQWLHSHGADFRSSFPSLPTSAFPKALRSINTASMAYLSPPIESATAPPSDTLLRTIIDALPVQVFTAQPFTGNVTWVNSRYLAYGGRSGFDPATHDPWDALHPNDVKDFVDAWSRSLRTGQQCQHKVRIKRFDGQFRHQYVRIAPLKNVDQRIVHWVGVIADIHDQFVAEMIASKQQETAQSEAKYRALANSSPQIVFAVVRGAGITFCNTQWQAYSGQSEDDARGTGFLAAVHPDDLVKCKLPIFEMAEASNVPVIRSELYRHLSGSESEASSETVFDKPDSQRQLAELATTGILKATKDSTGKQSYSTEVRLRSASGEYRWHLVRVLLAEPLLAEGEETWYGTCTDINDHKELERTLKETMDAKSRFMSNMSHEIRTPLNGIWGMTNFLIDSSLTPEQADHVNVIRASTEGLRDLINDILDLSKVEAGMITLSMDWLHLRSVIEEVNDLTSSLALDKGIELNYLIETDVPSMIKGDRFRIRQVLLNVIGNAIKFTFQGEVYIKCSKEASDPDGILLRFDVMDTGRGFSEKDANLLFKRFSQIDGSSTRQHGGSGLGLVISMQLVELHGGKMSATSKIGEGSCFTFTMKFGIPSETEPSPPTPLIGTEERVRIADEMTQSPMSIPSISGDRPSPSSAGSANTALTAAISRQSSKSSQSSFASIDPRMRLEIRPRKSLPSPPIKAPTPKLYSVLVVCPMPWARDAIVGHLASVMSNDTPHTITARDNFQETTTLVSGEDAQNFSHIVITSHDITAVMTLIQLIFQSQSSSTTIVVIADLEQKKGIMSGDNDKFSKAIKERRLQFIQKPIKPSRLAPIFDPNKEHELSTDVNQSSAQEIAETQKQVLDGMSRTLHPLNARVLLVEDNTVNQMVMLKLFKRIDVAVDTAIDGIQAVEKVLSSPVGYYSIVLMDLMMPNKDGYEACEDIRAWEKANQHRPVPIVSLSANVLDDVWRRCRAAGFNAFLTKPLQFGQLSDVMISMVDRPADSPLPVMPRDPPPSLRSSRR